MSQHRKRGPLALAFILLAAHPFPSESHAAPPGDPVGTWKLRCVSPDGKARVCFVTVSREGDKLKGTYAVDGEQRAAKEVAFDRGELSIRVDGNFCGQVYRLTYKGRPEGDSVRGSVRWSYGFAAGSIAFAGERVGQKVATAR